MAELAMFWGSNTGNQEEAAGFLKDFMESEGIEMDEYNIADTEPKKMLDYKYLIIGCPTWHIGELQDDWDFIYEKYKELDFSGVTAAFFGCGDQVGYSDNFLDALGLLAKPFMESGGTLIGRWPVEEYEFDNSLGQDGDEFYGLGLDNDNEEELSEERLVIWGEQIKEEFGF